MRHQSFLMVFRLFEIPIFLNSSLAQPSSWSILLADTMGQLV
jgi:hypothetical protein